MEQSLSHQAKPPAVYPASVTQIACTRDSSGYAFFSQGEQGRSHALAHWMLDHDLYQSGYEILGEWIDGRTASGSQWAHLQWHMAVFELALGKWDDAYSRFLRHILPVAATSQDALTDAPSMLWRLSLSSSVPVELPWDSVRLTALASLNDANQPYVEIHHLLALAGAGDLENLDRWISTRKVYVDSRDDGLVRKVAMALRAYVIGDFACSSQWLTDVLPEISTLGGSRAQNQLFAGLARDGQNKARKNGITRVNNLILSNYNLLEEAA